MTLEQNNENEDIISESNDKSKDEESKDPSSATDQEFIFIHDTGFNVLIHCPGLEAFEIQVCLSDTSSKHWIQKMIVC
jgi:hypothetical protein